MSNTQIGRLLVLVLALILGIWLVDGMSWKNKYHKLIFRVSYVMFIIRGIGYLAFDILGLFPLD